MQHSVREVELDNGARGLVVHVPGVDVVRLLLEFRAGIDLGDWQKFELPHVLEHLMFTNETYPRPRQFSREVERNGAYHNALTDDDSLAYEYECANFEIERIAKLAAIQMTEPTFPEREFQTELGNVAEEIKGFISNPARSAAYNLCRAQIGAPSHEERIEQLDSITIDDLRRWYRYTHRAGNLRFIVAGDVDFDTKVLPHLNVSLPAGDRLDLPGIVCQHVPEPIVEPRDMPQMYYFIGSSLGRPMSYREVVAARVATNILSAGFSSTLLGKAREKGLAYGLDMSAGYDMHETSWSFRGLVSPDHAKDFFDLARREIDKVQAGRISKRQFEATKRLMRGDRARSYQKVSDFVGYYDSYFTVGYEEFNEFNRILDEVTIPEVVEKFNELFSEGRWGMSLLGAVDDETARKYHQQLAPLWQTD